MGCLLNIVKCTVILYFLSLYISFSSTFHSLSLFPSIFFCIFCQTFYSFLRFLLLFMSLNRCVLSSFLSFQHLFSFCFTSLFVLLHSAHSFLSFNTFGFYPSCPITLPVRLIYLPFHLSYPTILSFFYFCFQTENLDNLFILEKTKFVWVLL